MVLISAENISKSYGDRKILDNLTLHIDDSDKLGIVGINGTGKSTLLKIIAGEETSDTGSITYAKDLKISFLPQNPVFNLPITIMEQVLELVQKETVALEYQVQKVLNQLGVTDLDRLINTLSGGEKKKVAVAVCLLTPCDIILLDEPTNHLDIDSVLWLEVFLQQFKGAVVMVTHDRYFLDRISSKIGEIRRGDLFTYNCNFKEYLELKSGEEESLIATQRKDKSLYRKELEWIMQGAKARGTKSKERTARFHQLEDKVAVEGSKKLELSSLSTRLGRQIIELEGISKSYDEKELISGFSYNVLRDDRIGIIGKNGTGKTTLLNIIAGEILPDFGEVISGSTVKIGYYNQENDDIHTKKELRVIDYIKETAGFIQTVDGMLSASQMLERFLFSSDLQYTLIGRISGGEQKRLFLLKLLMEAPNILLLDEPTNDLDIVTLQILEDYLENFSGAVLTVSHDRYFLDKVVSDIFAFEGGGVISRYGGNYSDYLEHITEEKADSEATIKEHREKHPQKPRESNRPARFSFNEKREYEVIDKEIEDLEAGIEKLDKDIVDQSANYEALERLLAEKKALENRLEEKMQRWVYLNQLADEILGES